MANDNGFFINYVMSSLLKKITVPSDYHQQVKSVKGMLEDDVSGLVDVLTDFAVNNASVNFRIETGNDNFTRILNKWLEILNLDYEGIPIGIDSLSEEYFKERWKSSSFPILKVGKDGWKEIEGGIIVPTKMFFVDGEYIHAKPKDENLEGIKLENYDYYLGSTEDAIPLKKNVIITKPFSRWQQKYPTPYLIKRGVYHNWKIIESLKNKQTDILDRVIPYMLLIKKGTEAMYLNKDVSYNNDELQEVINKFQDLVDKYEEASSKIKAPVRATNFDEELKHFIPDLSSIMNSDLFVQAERNILSGLGFIDVVEAVSTSRKESILQPKAFIEETKKGVKDFKKILKRLVLMIVEKNPKNIKYINSDIKVTSSPITGFMTSNFKDNIRQLYTRGLLSKKTTVELIGEVDFDTEVKRREKEEKDGLSFTLYPPIERNQEGKGIDFKSDINSDNKQETDKDDLPDDKTDPIEKQNYDIGAEEEEVSGTTSRENEHTHDYTVNENGDGETSSDNDHKHTIDRFEVKKVKGHSHELLGVQESELTGSPYKTIKELPKSVKNNLSLELQRVFLTIFNKAYDTYENDTIAFKTAWSAIRKIAKQKDGKWVRKSIKKAGSEKPVKAIIDKDSMEKIMLQSEKEMIDEAFAMQRLSQTKQKQSLLDKLFKNK